MSALSWQKADFDLACRKFEESEGTSANIKETVVDGEVIKKKSQVPRLKKVFFCSRTHSQLQQIIDELRKCNEEYHDHMKMCLLSSRQNLCINSKARERASDKSLDEVCREMVDLNTCSFTFKTSTVSEQLANTVVWDIEDAIRVGQKQRGCPYYASRANLEDANFIVAPYQFLLDSNIRKSLGIDLKDSTIIFDEAHNIEDCCRSSASFSISKRQLQSVVMQLEYLSRSGIVSFQSLHSILDGIFRWFEKMGSYLTVEDCKNHHNVWSGEEIMDMFAEFGLTRDSLAVYFEHLKTVLKDNDDISKLFGSETTKEGRVEVEFEEKGAEISASVSFILKDLFKVLQYMYDDDSRNTGSFKVAIELDDRKKDSHMSLNIWCLNSAVVFREIGENAHSILLSSGTLSPLDSFAGELGISFPVRLEASHVIDLKKQVFACIVRSSNGVQLDSSFTNKGNVQYLDAIGATLLRIATMTMGGTLLFFPSYAFLDRLKTKWSGEGGLISELDDINIRVFIEPKSPKELEELLREYYAVLDEKDGKAIFLAVCRGKVSEGINFSDRYARSLVVVGIPYPNIYESTVHLKKEYQDKAKIGNPVLVDGTTWYQQQAFRAINQAVGRCLRHSNDYGAIYLLDSRFSNESTKQNLSRWIRSSVQCYQNFEDTIIPLAAFFRSVEHMDPPQKEATLKTQTHSKERSQGPITMDFYLGKNHVATKKQASTVDESLPVPANLNTIFHTSAVQEETKAPSDILFTKDNKCLSVPEDTISISTDVYEDVTRHILYGKSSKADVVERSAEMEFYSLLSKVVRDNEVQEWFNETSPVLSTLPAGLTALSKLDDFKQVYRPNSFKWFQFLDSISSENIVGSLFIRDQWVPTDGVVYRYLLFAVTDTKVWTLSATIVASDSTFASFIKTTYMSQNIQVFLSKKCFPVSERLLVQPTAATTPVKVGPISDENFHENVSECSGIHYAKTSLTLNNDHDSDNSDFVELKSCRRKRYGPPINIYHGQVSLNESRGASIMMGKSNKKHKNSNASKEH